MSPCIPRVESKWQFYNDLVELCGGGKLLGTELNLVYALIIEGARGHHRYGWLPDVLTPLVGTDYKSVDVFMHLLGKGYCQLWYTFDCGQCHKPIFCYQAPGDCVGGSRCPFCEGVLELYTAQFVFDPQKIPWEIDVPFYPYKDFAKGQETEVMSSKDRYFAELVKKDKPPVETKKFKDFPSSYLKNGSLDYPDPTQTLLELGLWHTYLSSTFLNGWINYVTPIAASMITRYQGHSKNLEQVQKFHDPNDPEFKGHTNLGRFGDDVLLLGCSNPTDKHFFIEPPPEKTYWLFWFDCDVSDCCIGRFRTDVPEEQIIADFREWANDLSLELSQGYSGNDCCEENQDSKPALHLDVKHFSGWISF